MVKHRIIYETKDEKAHLVKHFQDFTSFADACTFLREIKGISVTKPVIEEVAASAFDPDEYYQYFTKTH